jgi:hypothetical protein
MINVSIFISLPLIFSYPDNTEKILIFTIFALIYIIILKLMRVFSENEKKLFKLIVLDKKENQVNI